MPRLLYTLLHWLALPLLLPYLAWRRRLSLQTFAYIKPMPDDKPVLWLHAVSVGEAVAADALITELQKKYACILTYTTDAGGAWLQKQHGTHAYVCRLPLDLSGAAARFIKRAHPTLVIMMEGEYWPNLLHAAKKSGAVVILANGRLSHRSARRYARVGVMRGMAACFDVALMQTQEDANRLQLFGAHTQVVGNLKFDRPPNFAQIDEGKTWRKMWDAQSAQAKSRQIILIAGSRAGEEALLITAMQKRSDFYARFYPIFAPRHIHRSDEVAKLLLVNGIRFARRSAGESQPQVQDMAYLADTLGEMDAWYAFCDMAIICGSFCEYGGQNPIEAMASGAAAMIGPYHQNYHEVVGSAVQVGALQTAKDADDAIARLDEMAHKRELQIAAAHNFCRQQQGALERHLTIIEDLVSRR